MGQDRLKGKKIYQRFIASLLTEEVTDRIRAGRYEQSSKRRGYRNGHYLRHLLIRFGPIEDIWVSRLDQGGMEFTVFHRYEHRDRTWTSLGALVPEWRQHDAIGAGLVGKEVFRGQVRRRTSRKARSSRVKGKRAPERYSTGD